MFRIAVFRSARAIRPQILRPCYNIPRRYESSVSDVDKHAAAKKAAQVLSDDLQRDWDAPIIMYNELLPKIKSPSPDSYLIDVREPEEVIQGMIPSAVNLPLSVLANSLHLQPGEFKARHGFEKPGKEQEVTFYCRSGKRSTSASDIAKRNGYTNVLNYTGSWLDNAMLSFRLASARLCRVRFRLPPSAYPRHRNLATPPTQLASSTLPIERYHALSDQTMDGLLHSLEELVDSIAIAGYEVEYHSGVLTLQLADHGTYVINKQPPNKQIWLSSPFSGPKRYDYVEQTDSWVYSRDGKSLSDLLNEELSATLRRPVDVTQSLE
ncbi:Frataxin, mitochondrial [Mycena indigotica]|uniref:ferroxidase n=1 Tax=Mycena indigotica TaxID=2126181 RepID=A0A8H6SXZ0_9AGAR|nr:Frataxin, mitochondrial [Mycena indigotica]KAF7306716.1 Frataxin, mitochondrial [Mycena indigotica]